MQFLLTLSRTDVTFAHMAGSGKSGRRTGTHREERAARNARSKAYINLAQQLAAVFSAGVYVKEDLQSAVCSYVGDMKRAGETGDTVVKAAEDLVAEIGMRFPASDRARTILADVLSWCMAEYYRESA